MAEDDGGLFEAFLNTGDDPSTIPGTDTLVVNSENPVSWLRVFGAALGGLFAAVTTGIAQIPLSAAKGARKILDGLMAIFVGTDTEYVVADGYLLGVIYGADGLLDVVFGGIVSVSNGVWSSSLEQFGILALPVAFLILLAATYVMVQGTRKAFSVLLGEEVF